MVKKRLLNFAMDFGAAPVVWKENVDEYVYNFMKNVLVVKAIFSVTTIFTSFL